MSNPKYEALRGDDDSTAEGESSDIDGYLCRRHRPRTALLNWFIFLLPWILTILFACLSLGLYLKTQEFNTLGTYERGFHTDLTPPDGVPLEKIQFTGTVHFKPNGTLYIEPKEPSAPWPENLQLFGEPSTVIDANWDRVLEGRYFSISKEQAQAAWGDQYLTFVNQLKGGWTAGFEVFHTLHCLNTVRQALRPDYYKDIEVPIHIEHCLNSIRQTIQCHGSTTLVPTRYWEGAHHNYIDADQTHTCRSFSHLRNYLDKLQPGGEAYVEPDKSVIDGRKNALAKEFMRKYRETHQQPAAHIQGDP